MCEIYQRRPNGHSKLLFRRRERAIRRLCALIRYTNTPRSLGARIRIPCSPSGDATRYCEMDAAFPPYPPILCAPCTPHCSHATLSPSLLALTPPLLFALHRSGHAILRPDALYSNLRFRLSFRVYFCIFIYLILSHSTPSRSPLDSSYRALLPRSIPHSRFLPQNLLSNSERFVELLI